MLGILFIPSKIKFEDSLNPHSFSNDFSFLYTKWDNKCACGGRKHGCDFGIYERSGETELHLESFWHSLGHQIEPEPQLNLTFFQLKTLFSGCIMGQKTQ